MKMSPYGVVDWSGLVKMDGALEPCLTGVGFLLLHLRWTHLVTLDQLELHITGQRQTRMTHPDICSSQVRSFEGLCLDLMYFLTLNYMSAKSKIIVVKKKTSSKSSKNPSPNKVVYSGPIRTLKEMNQVETATFYAGQVFAISSSVGGAINSVYGSAPSSTGDWSSLQATWHEYRTLGFELIFSPTNKYNYSITKRPMAYVVDHTDVGTLGSYSVAGNHESCMIKALDDPHRVKAKMSGTEEAEFLPTASPTSVFYIKIYADGLSFSQEYGIIHLVYRVQFRGRK